MNKDAEFSISAESISRAIANTVQSFERVIVDTDYPAQMGYATNSELNGIISMLSLVDCSVSRNLLIAEARTAQRFVNDMADRAFQGRLMARHSAPYEAGQGAAA